MVTAKSQAFCRYGPSPAFLPNVDIFIGDKMVVNGRYAYGGWLWVRPDKVDRSCWIAASLVEPAIDLTVLPIIDYASLLPITNAIAPPENVEAERNGDEVTISWDPIDVTPEGTSVRQFELVPTGEHLALLYWEDGGKEPGVYARMLDLEGKIETGLRKLSSGRKGHYYPTLALMQSGDFWAVWEEEIEGNVSDLVARRLGPDLEPKSNAVRLTAFRPPSGPARRPSHVSRVGSRSRTNSTYSACARPGISTATASGSAKPVR